MVAEGGGLGYPISLFLRNAMPDEVFKYNSNATAFFLFRKPQTQIIFHGMNFEVCLLAQRSE